VHLPPSTATSSAGMGKRSLRFSTAVVLRLPVALLLLHRPDQHPTLPASLSSLPMRIDDWSGTDHTPDKPMLALSGNFEFGAEVGSPASA
jgi:hypothetical protein